MATSAARTESLPSDRALDTAVSALHERGDHVAVVQLVEAWAAHGSPSQAARLREGRAFLHLRMMDRATARLREVIDQEPGHVEALLCLAEVYIERGWPQRARTPLAQLRDAGLGGARVDRLWERAHLDPVRPDLNARQIEREGDPERLVALAEAFLATGSFLRGRGILERLRRVDPDHARSRALLWGLEGETGSGGLTLTQLLRTLLPMPPVPQTILTGDDPEHTESFSDTTASSIAEGGASLVDDVAFPRLFKHPPRKSLPDAEETGEHTSASQLASAEQMVDGPATEDTDAGRVTHPHGDTQIMLVLRPGEEVRAAHKRKGASDSFRHSLNLREYQVSMGMSDGTGEEVGDVDVEPEEDERSEARPGRRGDGRDVPQDDDLLEEEDENLVVMTRLEGEPETAETSPELFDRPIEVIEKHAVPVPTPTAAAWVEPVVAESPAPPTPSRWLIFGLAAFALAMMAAFVLIVGSRLLGLGGANDARGDLLEAFATADYDQIRRVEGVLEGRLRGRDLPDVEAALAESRLVLWSEFNGDRERLSFVRTVLEHPDGMDVHRLAMLRAAYALATEDDTGARAALSRQAASDDEERLLLARLAARTEDSARALELFAGMSRPDAPRYALARAEILARSGRLPDASALVRKVLSSHGDHRLAHLAQASLAQGDSLARIAAADLFISRFRGQDLPPRVDGAAQALRARAYLEHGLVGKAREAADIGLARDGTNPTLLLIVADDEAFHGRLDRALAELENIVAARPGNAEAQAARVLTLLDLDRVREAEEVVTTLREAQLLPDLTPVLQGLITAWGRGAPLAVPIDGKDAESPLGAWLAAVAASQERSTEAAALAERAVSLLSVAASPFERRLVERAKALRVLSASKEEADALAEELGPQVVSDPVAQVLLGRYYESSGRRARAAQHFDRAAQPGSMVGLAWFERWRFYLDARDTMARSTEAGRVYLKLGPSGPRAERVAASLRRP